jgi:hypothetical protein
MNNNKGETLKTEELVYSGFPELKNDEKKVSSWEKKVNEWNLKDVQSWFYDFDGGKFKEYAEDFSKVDGKFLMAIPEKDFKDKYGIFNGGVLYLAIQNLQKGNYKLLRKGYFLS